MADNISSGGYVGGTYYAPGSVLPTVNQNPGGQAWNDELKQNVNTGSSAPVVISTAPAKEAVNNAQTKLQDILNPQSSYYQQNPGFLRPGETPEQYGVRNPPKETPPKEEAPKEIAPKIDYSPNQQTQIDTYKSNIDVYNSDAQAIRDKIATINNGTYLNPSTQQLLSSITSSYDAMLSKQTELNKATLAGFTQAGIRSGRSRYAPEIETGNLNAVMQAGLDKIQAISDKKTAAIAKAKSASDTNDFNQLFKQMQDYEKQSKEETDHMVAFQKDIRQAEKDAEQRIKDAQTIKINQDKQDRLDAQGAAYTVYQHIQSQSENASQEDIKKAVQEYAASNDLDSGLLMNEVQKLETTQNKMGTGPIGEYKFAQQNGSFKGSYTDWLEYKKSIGTKSPTSAQNLSPKQYAQFSNLSGLDSDKSKQLADTIWKEVASGSDLETIRGQLKEANLDPKILDHFDTVAGIEKVKQGAKPKSSSSSGFK